MSSSDEDDVFVSHARNNLKRSVEFCSAHPEETLKMVKKLVRLAIFTEHRKAPLTRKLITEQNILTDSRAFTAVFEEAQKQLSEVFGMQLYPVVKLFSFLICKTSESKSSSAWYLASNLNSAERLVISNCMVAEKLPDQQKNLEMVILSLIFVHGKRMPSSFFI